MIECNHIFLSYNFQMIEFNHVFLSYNFPMIKCNHIFDSIWSFLWSQLIMFMILFYHIMITSDLILVDHVHDSIWSFSWSQLIICMISFFHIMITFDHIIITKFLFCSEIVRFMIKFCSNGIINMVIWWNWVIIWSFYESIK